MISAVAKRIPTQAGDVLILQTSQSFTIYAVGVVTRDGQQDFGVPASPTHVTDRGAAIRTAKTFLTRGRRIFLRDIDSGDWSEISD